MDIYLVGEKVKTYYNYDDMLEKLDRDHWLLRKLVREISKKLRKMK